MIKNSTDTIMIVFYDSKIPESVSLKNDYISQLQSKVTSQKTEYPNYRLFQVEVDDNDAKDLVAAAHVNKMVTDHQPVVTATRNEVMVTFWGENPVDAMIKVLHTFTRETGVELAPGSDTKDPSA